MSANTAFEVKQPEAKQPEVKQPITLADVRQLVQPADHYRVLSPCSSGPDGIAYEAIDLRTDEKVELRRISPAFADQTRRDDIQRRLRALKMFNHPISLPVRGCCLQAADPYVVLDLPPNTTLTDYCSSDRVDPTRSLDLALQLASGIAAAHRLRIHHGSLEPATVFVDRHRVYLDFTGLRVMDGGQSLDNELNATPSKPADAEDVRQLGRLLKLILASPNVEEYILETSPQHARVLKQLLEQTEDEDLSQRPSASELERLLSKLVETSSRRQPNSTEDIRSCRPKVSEAATCQVNQPDKASTLSHSELLKVGSQLSRFRIEKLLGEGGMSVVFQAIDTDTLMPVAIKVIKRTAADSPKAMRRFEQEARLLSTVKHPNVANLIEVNENGGLHYMVLEFVDGTNVRNLLKQQKTLAEASALAIAAAVARGLVDAHRRGIVHRDIKPDNILLTRADDLLSDPNCVKLSDFGIAWDADEADARVAMQAVAKTTITRVGTPLYMSPEQFRSQGDVTPSSDIYSLGVTLFEMLAGRTPFGAADRLNLATRHAYETPPHIRKLNSNVSEAVAAVLEKTLAKRPADRFADASHFLSVIAALG